MMNDKPAQDMIRDVEAMIVAVKNDRYYSPYEYQGTFYLEGELVMCKVVIDTDGGITSCVPLDIE